MNILSTIAIADIAELLSACAAFLTVGLAFIELSFRSKAKKAETAMEIYSDYLYIKQYVDYAVGNVRSFVGNIRRYSKEDLAAFAQTHLVDPHFFSVVQRMTKECISSFDCLSAEGKDNSSLILEVSGNIRDLMLFINAFFTANTHGTMTTLENLQQSHDYIIASHEKILSGMQQAGDLLKSNLKTTHKRSNIYLVALLTAIVILLIIVFIL